MISETHVEQLTKERTCSALQTHLCHHSCWMPLGFKKPIKKHLSPFSFPDSNFTHKKAKKSFLQISYIEAPCSYWGLALFFHGPGRCQGLGFTQGSHSTFHSLKYSHSPWPQHDTVPLLTSPYSLYPTHIHLVHLTWFWIHNEGFLA